MKAYSIQDLADHIGAQVQGDGSGLISSIATLAKAGHGQISFLSNSKYRSQLTDTRAQAVILNAESADACSAVALIMDNPYVGFARVAQLLDSTPDAAVDIAPSAVVADDVTIEDGVAIGANAVIETGVVLKQGCQIGAGCFVGKDCQVGVNTKLWANVTLYHGTQMGSDCLVQSGTVIGADGFGYANDKGQWLKIPQLGNVIIGDRVEIGAATTIDRGALDDTVIADGVIIDNQCQIAHNVVIGENTAIAGSTTIAGSATIGRQCTIAGMVGINGHIEICDNAHFTGMTMVTKDVKEPGIYSSGMPMSDNKVWRKNMVSLRNLHDLSQRVKALEKHAAK